MNKSHLIRHHIVLTLFVLANLFATPARSQSVLEAGPLIGISWYNGDLNPQQQFYRIHPTAGVLVRYVVNDRIAFNASGSIAGISGAYPANNVVLPQTSGAAYRFNRNLGDITAKMELNLFSFDHPFNKKSVLTPYITFGIGSVFYKRYLQENGNDSEKPVFVLSLPFGGGVKWKATNSLKVGLEWTLRKTFVDDLDLVGFGNPVDPSDPYGFNEQVGSHNNDWISVFAASVTFTLKYRSGDCNSGF